MEEPMPLASPSGDDANIPAADGDGADPNEAFRRHLIKELLDTERQYVRDLEVMQVHFPPLFFFLFIGVLTICGPFVELRHRTSNSKSHEPGHDSSLVLDHE